MTLLPRASRSVLLVLVAVAATLPLHRAHPLQAAETLEKVGEFRPFPAHNKLGGTDVLNVVDSARRTWFLVTTTDPATGAIGPPNVLTFDLDGPRRRGAMLKLAGSVPGHLIGAVDSGSGAFFFVYEVSGVARIAAVRSTADGPVVAKEWVVGPRLTSETNGFVLNPAGLVFSGGKGYLAAESRVPWPKETAVLQFDVARLLAGDDPFDWRYRVRQCPALAHFYVQTAIGKSPRQPTLALPCRAQPGSSDLQGVAVVELGAFTPTATTAFAERFYPIAGDYGTAESYYDPVADRIAMRRVLPAQLVVFDMTHRRWMRPVVFGQNNMYQSALDEATGRIYGTGNDPGAGTNQEFVYVPELRPTPPQNGLTVPHRTPSSAYAVGGSLALDPVRRLVYVADVDEVRTSTGATADGLFFHVYREGRPAFSGASRFDPDAEVTNLSAESQGYGARISYVGGVGSTFSNALIATYPFGSIVGQGTRHVTFARTVRARLTEGESSAEAIVSHPEGASDSELHHTGSATGQSWPHESASCRDFGGTPSTVRDPSSGAEVHCDLDYPRTNSAAVYESSTPDRRTAPVQRAATSTAISVHATKGVTTTVTSEGSLDIPGIVRIGRMRASATTYAAGKKGRATSTYEREMRDVTIAGQPFCSSDCDPDEVAAAVNEHFAPLSSSGTVVVATVPHPDPGLLASPGGVQAIVQRDLWDHEEDVGIHDGADDRYELPAFVIALYQDRKYPQHEIYSLAGVQAVSRLPRALADDLDELASPDPEPPSTTFSPDLGSSGPVALADLDLPTGPAGSSLSAVPRLPRGGGGNGPAGSVRFSERLAWAMASPFRSPAMLAVLAFLAVPVYLSSRRRLLLFHRPSQAGDVDAA